MGTSILFSLTIIPFGSKPTAPDWMKVSQFINEKHKFLAKLFDNKEIFDGWKKNYNEHTTVLVVHGCDLDLDALVSNSR